jgi:hypothetical protein
MSPGNRSTRSVTGQQASSTAYRYIWLVCSVAYLALPGCGASGEGNTKVTAEARKLLLPHTAPNAKDRKGQPIGNRPLSIKDRVRPGTGPSSP